MSTTPQQTRLVELLDELGLSQAELARRSRTSPSLVASAVHGGQLSASGRARIIAAINARRLELHLTELPASVIFPTG